MKSVNILKILDDFHSSELKAILINGDWGIGKTYQITQFISKYENNKEMKKKMNIHYISLFGFKTIEQVNMYVNSLFNPIITKWKKSSKAILASICAASTNIPVVGNITSDVLSHSIGVIDDLCGDKEFNSEKALLKKRKIKKQKIIIFDDIERTDIQFKELLGYFNQLFLQEYRVICFGNKEKVEDKGFDEFKEKIFDRRYDVNEAPKEIIDSIFKEIEFGDNLYPIFNNNLRIASRTAYFLKELFSIISSFEEEYPKVVKIDKSCLLWYSALIVSGFNNVTTISEIALSNNVDDLDFGNYEIEESFTDNKDSTILLKVLRYDILHNYNRLPYATSLIVALTKYYLYEDRQALMEYFVEDKGVHDEFDVNILLLSSEEKKKHIESIIKKIDKVDKIDKRIILHLFAIFKYKQYFPDDFNEADFVKKIVCKLNVGEDDIVFSSLLYGNNDIKSFINALQNEFDKKELQDLLTILRQKLSSPDYKEKKEALNIIGNSSNCKRTTDNHYDVIEPILKMFENEGFFFIKMEGHLEEEKWEWNQTLCSFVIDYPSLKISFATYIRRLLDKSVADDERERLISLNKYYFSDINTNN